MHENLDLGFFYGFFMAGDWIKLQKDTFDKPEVLAIATRMDIDPDAVVGKLCRIWAWFDTHTVNGNASCVTFSFVDRYVGVTGFAEQVALVGWLAQDGHDLCLPNFDYHNGETSKTRALGKNRAEKARSNAKSNAPSVTKSLPEKRREEKNKCIRPTDVSEIVWGEYLAHRKAKKATVSNTVIESLRADAKTVGLTIEQAMQMQLKRGWTGFDPSWVTGTGQQATVFAGAI